MIEEVRETECVGVASIVGQFNMSFCRRRAAHQFFLNRGSASANCTPCSSEYLAQVMDDLKRNMKKRIKKDHSICL